MHAFARRSIRSAELLFPLCLLLSSPLVAQLPFVEAATSMEKRGEWTQAARTETVSVLQDWINLSATGNPELQAQYFTESGLLALDGDWAQGRDAVAEFLEGRAPNRVLWMSVGPVTPGSRVISASGRAAFQDEMGVERSKAFYAVLERHHGRWLLRMLSFNEHGQSGTSTPEGAIQPNGTSPLVPARPWIRLVVEPFVGMEREFGAAEALPGSGTAAGAQWRPMGGAIGIERNRTIELRGFYWQDQLAKEEPVTSYGGELRMHLFEVWRLRPHLSAGAARMVGSTTPDSAWMPVAGGGLGVRLTSMLDFNVFARDYMPRAEEYSKQADWKIQSRQRRWTVGAGLSLSLGRKPGWEDARPSTASQKYFGREWPQVQEVLEVWQSAYESERWTQLEATYSPSVELLHADGTHLWGISDVRRFWMERPRGSDLRAALQGSSVSGDVAYAESRIRSATAGETWDTLFTVLERFDRDQWRIRAQVLLPGGE